MLPDFLVYPVRRRATNAISHARTQIETPTVQDPVSQQEVDRMLAPFCVEVTRDGIVLTEEGFVTMAVVPTAARMVEGAIALPGADEYGQKGWFVMGLNPRPFHSRAVSVYFAVNEAKLANAAAQNLEAYFGGKTALKAAIARAPWTLMSTLQDAHDSGLCEWGIESFLRRYKLWALVCAYPRLPKFALWAGGSYPRRAIAATLKRRGIVGRLSVTPSTISEPTTQVH
jgi:hypothetical protein